MCVLFLQNGRDLALSIVPSTRQILNTYSSKGRREREEEKERGKEEREERYLQAQQRGSLNGSVIGDKSTKDR